MNDPLDEAHAFLDSLVNVERAPDSTPRRFGLDPVRALLARVGNPERSLRVLHIAGSKGKGSTALLSEAILVANGLRVGTFTSPHLLRWSERFRIDGREIEAEALVRAVEALRPAVETLRTSPDLAPTFFDVTTAMAFWLFREHAVDAAVVEVGVGGRLDSTNVVDPAVTAITSIELEHTRWLGDTIAAIAGEKAGIVKPGRPVVVGELPADAQRVVEARAQERGAPLVRLGHEFHADLIESDARGLVVRLRDGDLETTVRVPILGRHHRSNVAVAWAASRRLVHRAERAATGPAGFEASARRGLATARLPGRVERLRERPAVLIDAAHTPASARALAEAWAVVPHARRHMVVSISEGKALTEILAIWLPGCDALTLTRAEPTRSLDPADVADVVRQIHEGTTRLDVVPNPHLAVRAALERLGDDDLLCVAGSVYLAGIAREALADG